MPSLAPSKVNPLINNISRSTYGLVAVTNAILPDYSIPSLMQI